MTNPQTVFQAEEIISHKLDMPLVYSWVVKNEKLELNDINEIILNNKEYPYLSNFVRNAIENPQVNHYLFYYADKRYFSNDLLETSADSLKKKCQEKMQKDEENSKKINSQIKEFDQKLRKIFEENGLNYNIKIIHKDETIESAKNLYKKFNSNEKDCEEFTKNIDIIFNNDEISKKIDTLKILGAFYVQKEENSSALILDFDIDFKDLKLNFNKDNELIKFTLFQNIISEALIFIPNKDYIKQILLFFFKKKLINISIGSKLFIYFRNFILERENINNNDDLLNYLKNTSHENLLNDLEAFEISYNISSSIRCLADNFNIENFIKNSESSTKKYYHQILKDFNEYIKNNHDYKGKDINKDNFDNYINTIDNKKKLLNEFKDYLKTKHNYRPRLLKKENSTGLYNEFYFKNFNNEKFICKYGQSWTKNELNADQTFDIYEQTKKFIDKQTKQKSSKIDISEKSTKLINNNKENLISKTSIKNIFLIAFTTSIFLSSLSILITKKIDNNITKFKPPLIFCLVLTISFVITMSLGYYLTPKTQIQDFQLLVVKQELNQTT